MPNCVRLAWKRIYRPQRMQPKLSPYSQQSRSLDGILCRAVVFPQPARVLRRKLFHQTMVLGQFRDGAEKTHKPRRTRSLTKVLVSGVSLRVPSCPWWLCRSDWTHYREFQAQNSKLRGAKNGAREARGETRRKANRGTVEITLDRNYAGSKNLGVGCLNLPPAWVVSQSAGPESAEE
jgi:hypothetical protein